MRLYFQVAAVSRNSIQTKRKPSNTEHWFFFFSSFLSFLKKPADFMGKLFRRKTLPFHRCPRKDEQQAELQRPEEVHRTSSCTALQLAVSLAQFWHIGTGVFHWKAQTDLRADTSMPGSTLSWQCGQVALGLASSHPLRLSQTASHPKAYLHILEPSPRFSCYKDLSFHRF